MLFAAVTTLIAALSLGRMAVIAVLVMVGYGSYGYWRGHSYGLGWAGFKIYAVWGWNGGRRLNKLIGERESEPAGSPPGDPNRG